MAELKTKPTAASVDEFIDAIPDSLRRADCLAVAKLMKRLTRSEPKMWGPSIVGFGSMTYRNTSGKEMDWFVTGFSPRKSALTLYLGVMDEALLAKLGKHTRGGGCLYIRKLSEVDSKILEQLVKNAAAKLKAIMAERKQVAAK